MSRQIVVVNPEFRRLLRELRTQRGMSLRLLGEVAHYSHAYIWDLEEGRKTPSMQATAGLDRALNAEGRLVALVSVADCRPAPPPSGPIQRVEQLRRTVTDAIGMSGMSEAGVEDWERTALEHGRATRYRPARVLLDELAGDFAELTKQLGRRQSSSVLRRLTRVTAQMAGLMFLTLIKLDERAQARAWARTAYLAADEAADPVLRSWVRAQEAHVHYYCGDLSKAIAVAAQAQGVAGRGACVGVALAAALQARALAAIGDVQGTFASVGVAEAALADLDRESVIASAFGYNEAQLRFHEGNALTHLHDTARAWAAQQQALSLYDRTDYLDRTLVRLDRVGCLVHDGDTADAVEYGTMTLGTLTAQQRSGLINMRAQEIFGSLPSGQRALPVARELRELCEPPEEQLDDHDCCGRAQ